MANDGSEPTKEKIDDKRDQQSESEKQTTSKINNEADAERRSRNSKESLNFTPASDADKLLNAESKFIIDDASNSQKPVGKPNEVVETVSGDKVERLELDDSGLPKLFVDRNGDQIEKRSDGWYKVGLLSPEGEKLEHFSVDADRNVTIISRIPRQENNSESGFNYARRVIDANGVERTYYSVNGDSKVERPDYETSTSREGAVKTVEVIKDGKVLQAAIFENNKLTSFTAPDKTVYTRTGVDENGKPTWSRKDASGNTTEFNGNIKVDNDGYAFISTKDGPSAKYFANGTSINSNDGSTIRTLTTPQGATITRDASNPEAKTITNTNLDGSSVSVLFSQQEATQVTVKDSNGDSTFTRSGDGWLDSEGQDVTEKVRSLTNVKLDDCNILDITKGESLDKLKLPDSIVLEKRAILQEIPDNWQELLKERLSYCANPMFRQDGPNKPSGLYMLYSKTKDNAEWDDKQNGSQYQAWGNVAWGMYAAQTRMDFEDSIWWNGAVKKISGKSQSGWGSPMDIFKDVDTSSLAYVGPLQESDEKSFDLESGKTYGQNPADAKLIKKGYDQFDKFKQPDKPLPTNPLIGSDPWSMTNIYKSVMTAGSYR